MPRAVTLPVLALMCLLSLQAAIQIVLGKSIFLLLDKISCLAFLVAIALLWAGLLAILALSLVVPFLVIHDLFVTRFRGHGRRPRRWEYTALTLYFGCIAVVIWLSPNWLPNAGLRRFSRCHSRLSVPAANIKVDFAVAPSQGQ